jgi:protease-4
MASTSSSKWFWGIFLSLIFLGLVFVGLSFFFVASVIKWDRYEYHYRGSGEKIGVIEIDDIIIESERPVEQIKKFRDDKSIKAIILRVNSPGGGVAASQEIYEEVRKTRESGKIIVVSMGSIAASGGYYISCGSNLIVANPGTVTGSIGVIAQFISIKDLADKLGIEETTIKSGELKDAGDPFKKMSEKDKAYMQDLVNNIFAQFTDVVVKERKINRDTLMKYADGRVFTGVQAKQLGLIDSLGTFEDAIRITARLAGIEGEPRIVKERRRFSWIERMLGTSFEDITDIQKRLFKEPILQYRYKP